jgi:MoxR-like ATPase
VKELHDRLRAEVAKVVVGQDDAVEALVVALALGGHALLEGVPGVAKTLLANTVARALGLDFGRVQFTPDMLPSDITGTVTLRGGELSFRPGPVFTNVLLADEINRTPPKTQAALLEAMQEGQVTVDGEGHALPEPFLVVATQNPVEYEGTYPLPEAQLDRFMVRVSLGYPSAEQETQMLMDHAESDRVLDLEAVADVGEVLAAQQAAGAVHGSEALRRYVVSILDVTRADPRVDLGASPRAGLMLFRAAKALAALDGRSHALPDDVQQMAGAVLTHRLLLSPGTGADERETVVRDALERVPAL